MIRSAVGEVAVVGGYFGAGMGRSVEKSVISRPSR